MAKSNPLSLLGLAQRAGRTLDGESRILKAFQSSQIQLIFLAKDAGQNITKKIHDKCLSYEIVCVNEFLKEELSQAVGKSRTVIAVTDIEFAKMILKALKQ